MTLVNKKKTSQNVLHGQTNSVDNLKVLQQYHKKHELQITFWNAKLHAHIV